MNWKPVYDAFPINREMVWLNNCGVTPPGNHVAEASAGLMNALAKKGIYASEANPQRIRNRIKAVLSELLNAAPAELCLIHNTAEGMNFISHGFSFESGDEVILLENEYPSNVYPWRHLQKKGVRLITAPAESTPEAFFQGLSNLVTDKTRMITVSAVHWCTGMPLPLQQIGELCSRRNITFVVDGAQGVGMQPIDVKKMHIDYMAFSAWKWLMGPVGLGAMYIKEERLKDLEPVFVGTESVVMDQQYLPYKTELKATADRFTFSSSSIADWVCFMTSLEFLRSIGFETVMQRLYELTEHLNQRLKRTGFQVVSDQFPDHPTAISACEKEDIQAEPLVEKLKEMNVIAVPRLGRIRFSPHIYQSEYQMDEAARSLSQALMKQLYAQSMQK